MAFESCCPRVEVTNWSVPLRASPPVSSFQEFGLAEAPGSHVTTRYSTTNRDSALSL